MKNRKSKISIPSFLKRQKFNKTPGEAPGTIKFTGRQILENVIVTLHDYDTEQYSIYNITDIDDSRPYLESPSKTG